MPEIAEAQTLLVSLAESDDVRAAEAVRQRRLNLQMAYGQAMMWSKGFAAEETKPPSRARPNLPGQSRTLLHASSPITRSA